jgi:hypothetical protein
VIVLILTKTNRGRYDRSRLRYLGDMTDAKLSLVAPIISSAKSGGTKRSVGVHEAINTLL